MNNISTDLIVKILGLIIAIIGLPTAIFQLRKAYLEKKKAENSESKKEINSMPSNNGSQQLISNSTISGQLSTTQAQTIINIGDTTPATPSVASNDRGLDDSAKLQNEFVSSFVEDGILQHERIKIRNLPNGQIEGDVILNEEHTYRLVGTFRNHILTGDYYSVGEYSDERGTINLKLITINILSGFCTFSKISATDDDQVRMSPYVWVAGDECISILKGTYQFCSECHNENKKCCCASSDIDLPVLLHNEAQLLQASSAKKHKMKEFCRAIGSTRIRQMISHTFEQGGNKIEACHFYDPHENRCKIYDIRPTDCRLFPFDIMLDPNTNEYFVGYYPALCERPLPPYNKMKEYAHILRPQLFLLTPYVNATTRDDVCQKLKSAEFERLYKLNQFVF